MTDQPHRCTLAATALLAVAIINQSASSAVLVFDDLPAWQAEVASRGLFEYLEDFDDTPLGPIPTLTMGATVLTPSTVLGQSGTVGLSGTIIEGLFAPTRQVAALHATTSNAPIFGDAGILGSSITGAPIFAVGMEHFVHGGGVAANIVGLGLQGYSTSSAPGDGFSGIVSDSPIIGFAIGTENSDNLRIASFAPPVPEPSTITIWSLLGLVGVCVYRKKPRVA